MPRRSDPDAALISRRQRGPNGTLVLAASLLFAVCVVAVVEGEPGLAIAFGTLALSAIVMAVFQPHIHHIKAGPEGFEIETVRREEVQLATQLRTHLGGVGTLDLANGVTDLPRDNHLHGLSESLALLQFRAEEESQASYSPDPAAQLELARAALAEQQWSYAASMLERYSRAKPEDWEAQYARGVAHANSRHGGSANVRALQAYSDALTFLPRAHASNWLPRLYTYRGAMLKRLRRLEEAENDLQLAQRLASDSDDRHDISYNLAAVYAMSGNLPDALREIRTLMGTSFIQAIEAHSDDYFANLTDNSDFRVLIASHSPMQAEPTVGTG